jgi:hypothetical protein
MEIAGQAGGSAGVRFIPVPDSTYQVAKLLDGLSDLLSGTGIPDARLLPARSSIRFQFSRGLGDGGLCRHEGGAAEHPRHAEKLVTGGSIGALDQHLQPIQALARFEGKEISRSERIGHERLN